MLLCILFYLTEQDLCRMAQVSKHFDANNTKAVFSHVGFLGTLRLGALSGSPYAMYGNTEVGGLLKAKNQLFLTSIFC